MEIIGVFGLLLLGFSIGMLVVIHIVGREGRWIKSSQEDIQQEIKALDSRIESLQSALVGREGRWIRSSQEDIQQEIKALDSRIESLQSALVGREGRWIRSSQGGIQQEIKALDSRIESLQSALGHVTRSVIEIEKCVTEEKRRKEHLEVIALLQDIFERGPMDSSQRQEVLNALETLKDIELNE